MLGLLQVVRGAAAAPCWTAPWCYWPNELANGRHRLQNVPIVIATGDFTTASGQKLPTGRYLKYPGGTMDSGLLTRLGQMFGLPITNFGGAQWHHGPLPNLL